MLYSLYFSEDVFDAVSKRRIIWESFSGAFCACPLFADPPLFFVSRWCCGKKCGVFLCTLEMARCALIRGRGSGLLRESAAVVCCLCRVCGGLNRRILFILIIDIFEVLLVLFYACWHRVRFVTFSHSVRLRARATMHMLLAPS